MGIRESALPQEAAITPGDFLRQVTEDGNSRKILFETVRGAIIDAVYPVGSIYTSIEETSPAVLFGGTWERITGRFLLAATDGGATGTAIMKNAQVAPGGRGGEAGHTVTEQEMPSHTHAQDEHNHTQDSHNHTQNKHTHVQNQHRHGSSSTATNAALMGMAGTGSDSGLGEIRVTSVTTGTNYVPRSSASGVDFMRVVNTSYSTPTNQDTTATNIATTATNQPATATNQDTGGDEAHNNMPPFLAVYIWKRTA